MRVSPLNGKIEGKLLSALKSLAPLLGRRDTKGIIAIMNLDAYNAVRHDPDGAGVGARQRAWLKLTGADRQTFLNGQITNDVLYLQPGNGVHACLLNNTGHMMANLYVQSTPDALWIEVTRSRAEFVKSTLERFLIREKVLIEDVSDAHDTLTVQGQGARRIVSTIPASGAAGKRRPSALQYLCSS